MADVIHRGAAEIAGDLTIAGNLVITDDVEMEDLVLTGTLSGVDSIVCDGPIAGTGFLDNGTTAITGDCDVTGAVTGATTNFTLLTAGTTDITGDLDVTGEVTAAVVDCAGAVECVGLSDAGTAAITGDCDVTGAVTAATTNFTLLTAGTTDITGDLDVTGEITAAVVDCAGAVECLGLSDAGTAAITGDCDITGGVSAATTSFTLLSGGTTDITGDLDVTGEITAAVVDCAGAVECVGLSDAGTTAITGDCDVTGAVTAATTSFTLLSGGTTDITGDLDVTGEITAAVVDCAGAVECVGLSDAGTAAITGDCDVTGGVSAATTSFTLLSGGTTDITGDLDVTGEITAAVVDCAGAVECLGLSDAGTAAITGDCGVTGAVSCTGFTDNGTSAITGDLGITGALTGAASITTIGIVSGAGFTNSGGHNTSSLDLLGSAGTMAAGADVVLYTSSADSTVAAPAAITDGMRITLCNVGTGTVTFDPDTISGAANVALTPYKFVTAVRYNGGTEWVTIASNV